MASRGINKVILVGNVGQDPEIRFTQNQQPVANMTLATNEQWNDRQTGQKQERTEWHRLVVFGRLAEVVQNYVKKGQQIYVEGKLQTRKWQDQQGQDKYTTEIVVNEMQMLGGRGDAAPAYGNAGQSQPAPQQNYGQQSGGYGQPQGGNPYGGGQPGGGQQAAPQHNYGQPQQAAPQQPVPQQPAPQQPAPQQSAPQPAVPQQQAPQQAAYGQPQPQSPAQTGGGQQPQNRPPQPGYGAPDSFNDFDDDIPF
ncbi:hypothetical protein BFW38_14935 [Terasakiispira papahanaumokuakeensis]|uniref:Single-stranded DNA-binding protein n=1 Tax=Terasakiispira papahanaumokuakeensis TaxID=197479 RepID=A0A1E2VC86_9GAMM|nr:single-stranded DNA-binding protein [Terasakiispira papahanaumokuakeensis]ODC04628.1 hypothetical protein BFW38_14935 [Terasakiispira papahanaumokuakeensis]